MKIDSSFYKRTNVAEIAMDLLGKILCTRKNGIITKGVIVETEAYSQRERACHAYGNRKTERTAIMFGDGGYAYVYLVYGIHFLFNIVTNCADTADAVLIRAIEPMEGVEKMMERRGLTRIENRLTAGPGSLSRAMGIDLGMYGLPLNGERVWLEHTDSMIEKSDIISTKRVGVDYAGEDALLPWRFYMIGNRWVSR